MSSIRDPQPRMRWQRNHVLELSARGKEAEEGYMSGIVASRAEQGRASYDSAQQKWSETFHVGVDDGLYLCELKQKPMRFHELVDAMESCGKTSKDVRAGVERLMDAGLLDPAPAREN